MQHTGVVARSNCSSRPGVLDLGDDLLLDISSMTPSSNITRTVGSLYGAVRQYAATYPDSVNPTEPGWETCRHFDDALRPSCIVGHALDLMDLDDIEKDCLREVGVNEVQTHILTSSVDPDFLDWPYPMNPKDLEERQLLWLHRVQALADSGMTWGDAAGRADEELRCPPVKILVEGQLPLHHRYEEVGSSRYEETEEASRAAHPTAKAV